MFIPHNLDTCIFSYNSKAYQMHYNDEEEDISFTCFDDGLADVFDLDLQLRLLKHLIDLSEKAIK